MIRFRPALLLAVAASGTAICMSVLAGWQRGGWFSERATWVAIGVVLVTGTQPSSCCRSRMPERFVCPLFPCPSHRGLAAVMADRATVTAELAEAEARRCIRDCPALRVRRVSLAARVDALDAEAGGVRRYQTIEDGNAERRETARDDPVTARLAMLCGIADVRLELLAGLAFAAVLEGMACLLWWITLMPQEQKSSVTDRHGAVLVDTIEEPTVTTASASTVTEPETEVTKLLRDIESGVVKPTVAGIRRHLGCSQAKAAALRKQIVSSSL